MARVVLPLLILGLMVYALADLAGSDEEDRGGLPTWLWVVLIIFLPLVGASAWILMKWTRRRSRGTGGPSTRRPTPPPRPGRVRRPSGPVAPDDDPEFLWRLEQERRRQQRRRGSDGSDAADPSSDGAKDDPSA